MFGVNYARKLLNHWKSTDEKLAMAKWMDELKNLSPPCTFDLSIYTLMYLGLKCTFDNLDPFSLSPPPSHPDPECDLKQPSADHRPATHQTS